MRRRTHVPRGWKFSGLRAALQLFFLPYGLVVVALLFLTFGPPIGGRDWLGPLSAALGQPGLTGYLLAVAGGAILAAVAYAILAYPERWNRYAKSFARTSAPGMALLIPQLAAEEMVPFVAAEHREERAQWRFLWGKERVEVLLEGDELLATVTVGPVDSVTDLAARRFIACLETGLTQMRTGS